MGLDWVWWAWATVRASMVSSTVGAADLAGRRRGGEESGEDWVWSSL